MTGARMSKGEATRQRILDAAEASIFEKGFTATSIDVLIVACGLTKGGFFYHFRDRAELGMALINRYKRESETFEKVFVQARALVDDPLQVLLLALKLIAEIMHDIARTDRGLAVAVSIYCERQHDREIWEISRRHALGWRQRLRPMFDVILERYRPRESVDLDELSDMVSTIVEGGIVMSKALDDPGVLRRQLLTYRALLNTLFVPIVDEQ